MTHPELVDRPRPEPAPLPQPAEGIPEPVEGWWRNGEQVFAVAVDRLTDADLAQPSRLPGWSRATLVAHLARNADALLNLLTWARTGIETPMYASQEARDADIARTAAQPAATLRADGVAAAVRLIDAVESMTPEAWTAPVRTAQGRTVRATEVVWLRTREVWIHAVDLDAHVTFTDLPLDLCRALVDDVLALLARRGQAPAVTLVALDTGRRWGSHPPVVPGPVVPGPVVPDPVVPDPGVPDPGVPHPVVPGPVVPHPVVPHPVVPHPVVRAPMAALVAWLTRGDTTGLTGDPPPPLPRWL